ncbi:MAG: hypothetical protein ACP5IT_12255 [Thermoproteota archaeon]
MNEYDKYIRKLIEEKFDYIEALLGSPFFPRSIMSKASRGQFIVSSKEKLLEAFEEAHFQDCFVATHSEMDKLEARLKVVFFDFDDLTNVADAIRQALKVAERIKNEYDVKPHVQFSGFKGAHVILPLEPIEFEKVEEAKAFLAFLQRRFLDEGKNLDRQIIGDISRLMRLPFTINTKALDTPWKGFVKVLQEWDGNYANVKSSLEFFELKKVMLRVFVPTRTKIGIKKGIRKEIQELIERARKGEQLVHSQRFAILLELLASGYPEEDIIDVFRKQEDFDERKTRYFIEHARKKGYKPFSHERLKEILEGVRS